LPVLSCYRSQHENLSWLAALTAILDTPALLIAAAMKVDTFQAELTFVTAGHTVSDLAQACYIPPIKPDPVQLPQQQLEGLRVGLEPTGLNLRQRAAIDQRMTELRGLYEPSVNVLGRHFRSNCRYPFRIRLPSTTGRRVPRCRERADLDTSRCLNQVMITGINGVASCAG
jgi:hypothetical protein